MPPYGSFRITENFPIGICLIDHNFVVVYRNKILEKWSGNTNSEIIGRSILECYPHLKDALYLERIKSVLNGGPPDIFSSQLHEPLIPSYLPDGKKRTQTFTLMPYTGEDKTSGALIIVEDVTELRKEVEAYRRMKDKAINALNERIEAEKEVLRANEEANLYLDILLHDINNLNTIILGYSGLLEESGDKSTEDFASRISLAAKRSAGIIESVSGIRKIRENNSELIPVSLDKAIKDAIGHFKGSAIEYTGSGYRVMADELLPDVFLNIIGNSIKYGDDFVKIKIIAGDSGECIDIKIEDDGPGIPGNKRDEIFDRFSRIKDTGPEGKGLGLYIVKNLVQRYGSDISVTDSDIGEGDSGIAFTFRLNKA
ncbi:PAS domain-containing sensor histidine kinase [Methanoplanus limicola]|uniref:histidine kinase n=1 Tax=Methanoplanus limicola DSM 2279 TaxID=937775 RepID=H1YYD3_9EURY|nr:PAS domain-containing sensor histidine kinase [Methanoplanus limicola]EHQ35031.1 PAS/PAC sensor signal transduction histidine kinase [Methanoplanus limicola DSM 2279]